MDDTGGGAGSWGAGGWGVAPEVRGAMLVHEAKEALLLGDPASAVAMAEEALEDDPDDIEALLVVADAAARAGQPEVAVLAAAHARARGGDPGAIEAVALLGACRVEDALGAADAVLSADPADARAWAVRGQALELLERPGAQAALETAHRLAPGRFPLPLIVTPERWLTLYAELVDGAGDEDRAHLAGAEIRWANLPSLAELREGDPPAPPGAGALGWVHEGRVYCTIYRTNLARGANSEEELVIRLRDAVLEEVRMLEVQRRESVQSPDLPSE